MSCAIAASLTLASTAATRPQTTTPGVVYVVKTEVTDTKIVIHEPARFVKHGVINYPRGAAIRYAIVNKGTRPYTLKFWETVSDVMRPHRTGTVFINWQFRGKYRYLLLYRGKPAGPKGLINIY